MKDDPDYIIAFVNAAIAGRCDIVKSLLDGGMDVNAQLLDEQQRPQGPTALHAAANGRHVALLRQLLAAGAHVNAVTGDAVTPLQLAAAQGFAEGAHLLLVAGADVNMKSAGGNSALHAAARSG